MKPLYEIKTQNSVKKAEWNIDHDQMITSISTDKKENTVSIWHLKKPYLQQYILKGQPGLGYSDFQWVDGRNSILCAQDSSLILFDMQSHSRLNLYSEEDLQSIVKPYSRVQSNVVDMSLNDEIAIFSDPIHI